MAAIEPLSILLILIGIPFTLWPYQVTKIYEIVDAIGRSPSGPVEPADWYVTLTRISGILFLGIGSLWIVSAVV